MENEFYPFENLPLPYGYDAMEPFIDTETMMLHHDRHLQTYINNLNAALKDQPELQKLPLPQLIRIASQLPREVQTAIRNNAGGVYNHRFFFDLLANPSPAVPQGPLVTAIDRTFGSLDQFKALFQKAALSVFGSGYAWLVFCRGGLKIITTPNQNSPVEYDMCPILVVDVWEHAYYLKHHNLRADYLGDWSHIINWEQAERNFETCF